ncbi:MAG: hypothetical protein AAB288_11160, partial [Acidobacteriota bacterium]
LPPSVVDWYDEAAEAWMENRRPVPAGNFPRGDMLHDMANGNLAHDFPVIDHFDHGHAVSTRSHGHQTAQGLVNVIRRDLQEMDRGLAGDLAGRTADGQPIVIRTTMVQSRGLQVGVRENMSTTLLSPSFRQAMTRLSQQFRPLIRVIPVRRF